MPVSFGHLLRRLASGVDDRARARDEAVWSYG